MRGEEGRGGIIGVAGVAAVLVWGACRLSPSAAPAERLISGRTERAGPQRPGSRTDAGLCGGRDAAPALRCRVWLELQGLERPGLARRRYRSRRGRGAAAPLQRREGPRPARGAAFRAGAGPATLGPTPLCGPRAVAAGVKSGAPQVSRLKAARGAEAAPPSPVLSCRPELRRGRDGEAEAARGEGDDP